EPVARIGEERGEISAEIGAQTRTVLREIPQAPILFGRRQQVPADGRLEIARRLPPRLAAAKRIVLAVRASAGSRAWQELPPIVAPVRTDGRTASFAATITLPDALRGREVSLRGRVFVPHAGIR